MRHRLHPEPPVDLMDTELGAYFIVSHHHGWRKVPATRDECCAFCADQVDATPIWFRVAVHHSRLD